MKHLSKIVVIALIAWIIYGSQSLYSSEIVVSDIRVQDSYNIDILLSENPDMDEWVQENIELVILEDVMLSGGILHSSDSRSVELITSEPIVPNTQYSLLTLTGAEGSIDFKTPAWVEWFTANNSMSMKSEDIDSIEILDDRTILVTFRQELTSIDYDFKLFAELEIEEIRKNDFQLPVLSVETTNRLKSETNYLLMFIDMFDAQWRMMQFDTGIYDFQTPEFQVEEVSIAETDSTVYLDDELEEEDVRSIEQSIIDAEIAFEAAPEQEDEGNIEEMASEISELDPEAWAATSALIFLALMMNVFFFKSRLKKLIIG